MLFHGGCLYYLTFLSGAEYLYLWKSPCNFGGNYFWCLSFRQDDCVTCEMLRETYSLQGILLPADTRSVRTAFVERKQACCVCSLLFNRFFHSIGKRRSPWKKYANIFSLYYNRIGKSLEVETAFLISC